MKATKKKFMREPMMKTTEPSVDEVGMGMKKGGKTKKMAMGGNPMAGYPARPRARMAPASAMGRTSTQQPMAMGSVPSSVMRKKGGEVESKAVHMAEMKKLSKVGKELKSHESKPASKAHKGLKMGGSPKTGGIEVSKYKSGGTPAKFKDGGHAVMTCKKEGGHTQLKKMAKC